MLAAKFREISNNNKQKYYFERIEDEANNYYKEYLYDIEQKAKEGKRQLKIDLCLYCDSNLEYIDYEKNKYTKDCEFYHRVKCKCELYEKDIIDFLRKKFKDDGFTVSNLEYSHDFDESGHIYIYIYWFNQEL